MCLLLLDERVLSAELSFDSVDRLPLHLHRHLCCDLGSFGLGRIHRGFPLVSSCKGNEFL